jgi:hypothetical protein
MSHPPKPKFAPQAIREQIIECLRFPWKRSFKRDDHRSRQYLDLWGLKENALCEELCAHLQQYELYVLPKGQASERQKYQFVMPYLPEDSSITVLIHIKMTPRDQRVSAIQLSVHDHNTGYAPLPLVSIQSSHTSP